MPCDCNARDAVSDDDDFHLILFLIGKQDNDKWG